MMTIKDLPSSKELDSKALAEVRGGQTISVATVNTATQDVSNLNAGFGPSSSFALGVQEQNAASVVNAAEVNTGYYLPYFGW